MYPVNSSRGRETPATEQTQWKFLYNSNYVLFCSRVVFLRAAFRFCPRVYPSHFSFSSLVLLFAFVPCAGVAVVPLLCRVFSFRGLEKIGFTHVRVADGVNSLLQLMGMCARLCRIAQQDSSSLPS